MDKGHTAHVTRSRKTRHIADHPAAQGKQHSLAITSIFKQGVKNKLQRWPIFVRFAIRQDKKVHLVE